MMGARRAGKTSVLASLTEQFKDEAIKSIINIVDVQSNGADSALQKKMKELRSILQTKCGKTILCDEGGTNAFDDYVLKVALPDGGETNLMFTDANGEFYANGSTATSLIEEKIKEYDVIIIAIDTPYLMESVNQDNKLCRQTTNRAYNQIDSVHRLLCSLDDNDGKDAKLVLFVPIKCEKWVLSGQINKVTERIEQCYDAPIKALCAFKMIEVAVIPVQTVGSMEFDCHLKAKVLNNKERNAIKCSELENGRLILEDGTIRPYRDDDKLSDDMTATIEGFPNIVRPNSWFKVISTEYRPQNCDQLAFFILHYMLSKTMAASSEENKGNGKKRKWRWIAAGVAVALGHPWIAGSILAYDYVKKKMGTIDAEKMATALDKIKQKGVWHTSTQGVKIINKGFL